MILTNKIYWIIIILNIFFKVNWKYSVCWAALYSFPRHKHRTEMAIFLLGWCKKWLKINCTPTL